MKKAIWLSFDFGLKGDYTSLYTWLDNHKAKECGPNLAFFSYTVESASNNVDTLFQIIKSDLVESIKLSKNDRLYILLRDGETKKVKGRWINGSRKAAAWEGYGKLEQENIEDEGE